MEITTKFRKPVPYDTQLKGIGKVVSNTSRFVQSKAQILDIDGNVLAEADIKYLKLPADKIVTNDVDVESHNIFIKDDVKEID